MPPISRFIVRDEILEKLFKLFFEVVGNADNRNEFELVLSDILSSVERIMIAKRIAIIYLLMKNIDYLTICHVLKVSLSTVAKYSILSEKSQGVIPILKKIVKDEKTGQFLEETLLTLYGLERPELIGVKLGEINLILKEKRKQGFSLTTMF